MIGVAIINVTLIFRGIKLLLFISLSPTRVTSFMNRLLSNLKFCHFSDLTSNVCNIIKYLIHLFSGSVKAKPAQTEFSDDEDACQPLETFTATNWRSFFKAKASQAWSSDFSTFSRAQTLRAVTGLKRWTDDVCVEIKENLWDTRLSIFMLCRMYVCRDSCIANI